MIKRGGFGAVVSIFGIRAFYAVAGTIDFSHKNFKHLADGYWKFVKNCSLLTLVIDGGFPANHIKAIKDFRPYL